MCWGKMNDGWRYKLMVGKWGMYVHDKLKNIDINMEEVCARLNRGHCRKCYGSGDIPDPKVGRVDDPDFEHPRVSCDKCGGTGIG